MHSQNLEINQVKIEFSKKEITAYGGFSLVAGFLEKIKFNENIKKIIPIEEKSNNSMGIEAKITSYLCMILAGGSRYSHLLYLGESSNIFSRLFKIKKIPKAASTLTRGLFKKINSILKLDNLFIKFKEYNDKIIPWKQIKEDYLSFDSSVLTRYGNQSGAKKGYNPKKPGRKSHHPLIGFLTESSYVVNIKNRSGDKVSGHGIIAFFNETYEYVNSKITIKKVLADSGFYLIELIKLLELKGLKYIIAAPLSHIIQRRIIGLKNWKSITTGIDVAEFKFKHEDVKWDKERRYIAIRQQESKLDEARGKQLSLFDMDNELAIYKYSLYITNDEETEALEIWREYRKRPNDENTIKELKEDFGLEKFSMHGFYATSASMIVRILFYNIFNLFRNEILITKRKPQSERLNTIRYKYFILPAELINKANKAILRIGEIKKEVQCKIINLINKIDQYNPVSFSNCNAVEVVM